MCFQKHTFCCCAVPLWVGALMIGINEFITAELYWMVGMHQNAMTLFGNSLWFSLLFIPSLFYNPNYRKCVAVVHGITTIFGILGVLVFTILVIALGAAAAAVF